MRKDAQPLEDARLSGVTKTDEYPSFRERHRAFPTIFEGRTHRKVLDVAAGAGVAARRIHSMSPANVLCNDISHAALSILHNEGMPVISFDIDDNNANFPFANGSFDAVVSLATIEHIINLDHHVQEIYRVMEENGYLYISSPNYASLRSLPNYLFQGRSFHNPLKEHDRYEFYAHVRYFTYRTLLEYVASFGFQPEAVFLPLPEGSSYYRALKARSKSKATAFRSAMWILYTFFGPRWASEPVLCFKKSSQSNGRFRKVLIP